MKQLLEEMNRTLGGMYDPSAVRMVAGMLADSFFGLDPNVVYLCKDMNFSQEQRLRLREAVARLEKGEPVQYVVGFCPFYGHRFKVVPPVLIPRPETEELVDWVVRDWTGRSGCLLDVGTGSGCIAVSLAISLPLFRVEGWDILPDALSLCAENARSAGVNVEVHECDVFAPWSQKGEPLSLIVSNPPYICREEAARMEPNVLDYESPLALFVPDDDPLKFYRALALLGQRRLVNGGMLYLEINERFGEETCALLQAYGYEDVHLRKDLFGRDRMVRAVKPETASKICVIP